MSLDRTALYRAFGEFAEKAHGVVKNIETIRKELFEGSEDGRYQSSHAEITLPRRSSGGIVRKTSCCLFVQISTLGGSLRAVMEDKFDIGTESFNISFFKKQYPFSMDEPHSLVEMIDDIRHDHFQRMELEGRLYSLGLNPVGNSRTVFIDIDESNFVTHTFLKEREIENGTFYDEIQLIDSQIRDRNTGALVQGWEKNLEGASFIDGLARSQRMILGEDYIDGVQALAKTPRKLKEMIVKNEYV